MIVEHNLIYKLAVFTLRWTPENWLCWTFCERLPNPKRRVIYYSFLHLIGFHGVQSFKEVGKIKPPKKIDSPFIIYMNETAI